VKKFFYRAQSPPPGWRPGEPPATGGLQHAAGGGCCTGRRVSARAANAQRLPRQGKHMAGPAFEEIREADPAYFRRFEHVCDEDAVFPDGRHGHVVGGQRARFDLRDTDGAEMGQIPLAAQRAASTLSLRIRP
jgi:hypothetical protein